MKTRRSNYEIDMYGIHVISGTIKNHIILVNSDNGCWSIIHDTDLNVVEYLQNESNSYSSFTKIHPQKKDLLKQLFVDGVLRINGSFLKKINECREVKLTVIKSSAKQLKTVQVFGLSQYLHLQNHIHLMDLITL